MSDGTEKKRATAASFDGSADWYRTSEMHREGADLEKLADWCQDATIALDIATGAGHTAREIRNRGVTTVVATDASPAMVRTAVAGGEDIVGVVADAERLPFEDGSFEAVSCRIAAHHFPEPQEFVREVARVLTPDGVFALEDNVAPPDGHLDTFLNELEKRRDPTHGRSYRTQTWTDWLTDAGFVIEETDHMMKPLAFRTWVERMDVLNEKEKERIHEMLLNASKAAHEFFEIDIEDGEVVQFGSLKMLLRARTVKTDSETG